MEVINGVEQVKLESQNAYGEDHVKIVTLNNMFLKPTVYF